MPHDASRLGAAAWLAAALAGGVAIGFWMRGHPGPEPQPSVEDAPRQEVLPRRSRAEGWVGRSPSNGTSARTDGDWIRTIEAMAGDDPMRAQAELARLPDDSDLRAAALAALAQAWAAKDPTAAAAWVTSLTTEEDQVSAALGLVPEWTALDPDACLEWCLGCPPQGTLRELSLVCLADAWAERDPHAAFEGFAKLADEDGRERGLHSICSTWAMDDPDAALRFLDGLDPAARRGEFLEAALVSLTHENPERSWRQADMIPERAEHVRAMALEAIAETDPNRALALAGTVEHVPADWWRAIGRGWSLENPAAATGWARTLADPDLRKLVLEEIEGGSDHGAAFPVD